MIRAEQFVEAAERRGFTLYTGVPCSYLKPFINHVIDSPQLYYVGAANEGDAVAIAAGGDLGGWRSVVMLQNSGLGNTVNPLTSLAMLFEIPMLLIVTLRGEVGGLPDEPQHTLMGAITTGMLELMGIEWRYFPDQPELVESALDEADRALKATRKPFALVMRHGSVAESKLGSTPEWRSTTPPADLPPAAPARFMRMEMLKAVQAAVRETDIVIATTGYTGRELLASADLDCQLAMVGSMGCASSLGLGLAMAQPQRRVIVLDGDGALLMRMGAMATIGYQRPTNLLHVVLDNEVHESTGGQATVSHSIDFCGVAASCGYPRVVRVDSPEQLRKLVERAGETLSLLHVKIKPGVAERLPRPTITPAAAALRLREFLARTTR